MQLQVKILPFFAIQTGYDVTTHQTGWGGSATCTLAGQGSSLAAVQLKLFVPVQRLFPLPHLDELRRTTPWPLNAEGKPHILDKSSYYSRVCVFILLRHTLLNQPPVLQSHIWMFMQSPVACEAVVWKTVYLVVAFLRFLRILMFVRFVIFYKELSADTLCSRDATVLTLR